MVLVRHFFDTCTDSTFSRYSPGFFYFSVLTLSRPFSGIRWDKFSILTRILPISCIRLDSSIFRYSHWFGPFRIHVWTLFDTRTDSTFSRYSPGFFNFSVLTLIRPFLVTRWDNFSILARNLPFPGTRPDSSIFRYSHWFELFPVLVRTIFRYSHGLYLFPVLARILSYFGTHIDSTIFF